MRAVLLAVALLLSSMVPAQAGVVTTTIYMRNDGPDPRVTRFDRGQLIRFYNPTRRKHSFTNGHRHFVVRPKDSKVRRFYRSQGFVCVFHGAEDAGNLICRNC